MKSKSIILLSTYLANPDRCEQASFPPGASFRPHRKVQRILRL
jgi:hypothetical protein